MTLLADYVVQYITMDSHFDYTGHLLHVSDPDFRQLIGDVVGIETLNSIIRRSYIYSHESYTKYPFQVHLYGLPTEVIAECIEGFAARKKSKKKLQAFYDFVLENFGKGLAKHFFFPYQKKIFACNLNTVTAELDRPFCAQHIA